MCDDTVCIQDTLSSRAALGLPAFRPSASREQRYLAYNDTVTSIVSCILSYIQNITILYTIKYILINQRCRCVPLLNFKIIIIISTRLAVQLVYKIPYRRTRAWPLGRVRARAKVSCIQRVSLLGVVIVNQIYHMFHIKICMRYIQRGADNSVKMR